MIKISHMLIYSVHDTFSHSSLGIVFLFYVYITIYSPDGGLSFIPCYFYSIDIIKFQRNKSENSAYHIHGIQRGTSKNGSFFFFDQKQKQNNKWKITYKSFTFLRVPLCYLVPWNSRHKKGEPLWYWHLPKEADARWCISKAGASHCSWGWKGTNDVESAMEECTEEERNIS